MSRYRILRFRPLPLLLASAIASQPGCSGGEPQPEKPKAGYLVGGTVTNLIRAGLVLTLRTQRPSQSIEMVQVTVEREAISFVFPKLLESGTFYAVEVGTSPSDQACTVLRPDGFMGSGHVMNVAVSCSAITRVADAGAMNAGRYRHTATRLGDGKVLVAGGFSDCPTSPTTAPRPCSLSTAELYDPATARFTPTGSMLVARGSHTATLLEDGRVLIAGGADVGGLNSVRASAEIYDPATGAFTSAGDMAVARASHSSTRLANGKTLLAGGETDEGFTTTAELYDPSTGTFNATGSLVAPSYFHTATLLGDGRVLIAGGNGAEVAELYDPATGAFTLTGSMMKPRWAPRAALLQDGTVLMAGGEYYNGDAIPSAELYDPVTGTFTMIGPMFIGHVGHTAAVLPSGVVLFAGGFYGYVSGAGNTTEIYDPSRKRFLLAVPTLPAESVAILLADGRVLFTGGFGLAGSGLGSLAEAHFFSIDPDGIAGARE
jgi:Galactose oxidase, central domain/Kelch motif